jgi:hypothetical protein
LIADLIVRFLKDSLMNIRPLLIFPIKKSTIVHFFRKNSLSFFKYHPCFFLIPFSVVLIVQGYDPIAVYYGLSQFFLNILNNFINIILSNKDNLFAIGAVAVSLAALHYYDYFNITDYTAPF